MPPKTEELLLNSEQISQAKDYFKQNPEIGRLLRSDKASDGENSLPCDVFNLNGRLYGLKQKPKGSKEHDHIAEGAGGYIYLAQDLETGEQIVLKKLRDGARDEAEIQFGEQFGIVRGDHQGVKGSSTDEQNRDTFDYLIMEYIPGIKLRDALQEYDPEKKEYNDHVRKDIDIHERIRIVLEILHQVQEMHQAGIIHGDLKPENIQYDPDTGKVKVLDFGLAEKVDDDNFANFNKGFASGAYCPPEYYKFNKNLGFSADNYSLGKIIADVMATSGSQEASLDPSSHQNPDSAHQVMIELFQALTVETPEHRISLDEAVKTVEAVNLLLNEPSADSTVNIESETWKTSYESIREKIQQDKEARVFNPENLAGVEERIGSVKRQNIESLQNTVEQVCKRHKVQVKTLQKGLNEGKYTNKDPKMVLVTINSLQAQIQLMEKCLQQCAAMKYTDSNFSFDKYVNLFSTLHSDLSRANQEYPNEMIKKDADSIAKAIVDRKKEVNEGILHFIPKSKAPVEQWKELQQDITNEIGKYFPDKVLQKEKNIIEKTHNKLTGTDIPESKAVHSELAFFSKACEARKNYQIRAIERGTSPEMDRQLQALDLNLEKLADKMLLPVTVDSFRKTVEPLKKEIVDQMKSLTELNLQEGKMHFKRSRSVVSKENPGYKEEKAALHRTHSDVPKKQSAEKGRVTSLNILSKSFMKSAKSLQSIVKKVETSTKHEKTRSAPKRDKPN